MKYNLLFFALILISNYSFSQILPSYHAVHHKPDGIIEDNLILHLDASNSNSLNENDLSTWSDLSSSNNDVSLVTGFTRNGYTLNSNPSFSSDNGGSIIFNDDAAYRKSTFSNFSGNAFTVSMWIKTSQNSRFSNYFLRQILPLPQRGQIRVFLSQLLSIRHQLHLNFLPFYIK